MKVLAVLLLAALVLWWTNVQLNKEAAADQARREEGYR